MKVILLKDIGGVGKRNTIKDISDGYALNYLIPRGLAKQATPDQVAKLQTHLKIEAVHQETQNILAAMEVKALEGVIITIPSKANEKGYLYRQITPEIVAEAVNRLSSGIAVTALGIDIEGHIKTTGDYPVKVHLTNHTASVTVKVVAS